MTYPLLQAVDSADSILFDFHDPDGTNNLEGFKTLLDPSTFDLGVSSLTANYFKPLGGFAHVTSSDESLAEMSFVIWCDGGSSAAYHRVFTYLQSLIASGGRFKLQKSAAEPVLYIDHLGSAGALPSAYGAPSVAPIVRDGMDRGIEIRVMRQGTLSSATEVSSTTNKATNPTLLRDFNLDGTPDSWAWLDATNISAQEIAGEEYSFNIATTSARSFQQQSAAGSFASGDVVTFSFYVRAAAASVVRARAAVQFYQSDGTTAVGSEQVGALTDIGTGVTRVSVTTTAAGANTSRATWSIRFENAAATDTKVYVKNAQPEIGSAPTDFVTADLTLTNNPAGIGVVVDTFARSSTNSWGSPNIGGNWLINQGAAADFDVGALALGTIASTAANQEHRVTIAAATDDVDITTRFKTDKVAAGANQEVYVVGRQTAATTYYKAAVELRTGNTMFVRLDKVVSGSVTNLVAAVDTGETVAAGTYYIVRFLLHGSRLRVKVWLYDDTPPGVQEPATWDIDFTDTSITGTGGLGLGTALLTGATNATVIHTFGAFHALSPAGGRLGYVYVAGTAPTPVDFSLKNLSGQWQMARISVRASHNGARELPGYLNGARVFQLEEAAFLSNAGQGFDPSASNQRVATLDNDTDIEPIRRLRVETTEHLDSLRGTFEVVLRVKNEMIGGGVTGPQRAEYRLAWAPSLTDPASFTGSKIVHDAFSTASGGLATSAFIELSLGRIYLPEDSNLSGLCLEVMKSGPAECSLDYLALIPVDQVSIMAVPYIARRSLSKTDTIIDAPTEKDTFTLGVLAAGRYRIAWIYSAENTSDELFRFRIKEASTTIVESQDLTRTGDRVQAVFGLEFDADGSSSYSIEAEWLTGAGAPVYTVHERWIDQVPYLVANDYLVTDPANYRIEKRDSSDHLLLEAGLAAGGVPFVLDPGLYAVYVQTYEPRHEGWYRELKSTLTNALTLSYSYYPRHRQ